MSGFGESGQSVAARPQTVTIVGWLFVVGGVLGALGSLSLLGLGSMLAGTVGSYASLFGLVTLVLGVAEAWVGLQVLKLTAKGLQYGTMVCYASLAVTILMAFAFGYGFGTNALLSILIPAFGLWVFRENKAAFTN